MLPLSSELKDLQSVHLSVHTALLPRRPTSTKWKCIVNWKGSRRKRLWLVLAYGRIYYPGIHKELLWNSKIGHECLLPDSYLLTTHGDPTFYINSELFVVTNCNWDFSGNSNVKMEIYVILNIEVFPASMRLIAPWRHHIIFPVHSMLYNLIT
jgi:hypothetical protein